MGTLSSDTHPKMEALQIQLLRQASPAQKLEMLAESKCHCPYVGINRSSLTLSPGWGGGNTTQAGEFAAG